MAVEQEFQRSAVEDRDRAAGPAGHRAYPRADAGRGRRPAKAPRAAQPDHPGGVQQGDAGVRRADRVAAGRDRSDPGPIRRRRRCCGPSTTCWRRARPSTRRSESPSAWRAPPTVPTTSRSSCRSGTRRTCAPRSYGEHVARRRGRAAPVDSTSYGDLKDEYVAFFRRRAAEAGAGRRPRLLPREAQEAPRPLRGRGRSPWGSPGISSAAFMPWRAASTSTPTCSTAIR